MINEPPKNTDDINYTVMPTMAKKSDSGPMMTQPTPPPSSSSLPAEPQGPNWRKWAIIGGAVVLLALLGTLGYFLYAKKDNQEPAKESRLPKVWLAQHFGAETCSDDAKCGDEADPDNDGLSNYNEFKEGTNPNDNDTDDDGLADGDEVNIYKTDPGLKYTDRREIAIVKDFNDGRNIADGYDPLTPGSKMTESRLQQIMTDTEKFGLHEPTITTLATLKMRKLFHRLRQILNPSKQANNIVVAKVSKIEKHPNADRLQIVELTDGKQTISPVVCGAFNFQVGDKVALAFPGAEIKRNIHSEAHEPFVLQKATIRGIESQGMICAAFELGLSEDTEKGIMILKNDSRLGEEFNQTMV